MRYDSYEKQSDERFPEGETECARDDERYNDSSNDIYDRNIEYTVSMCAFSRTTEYIFVTAQVNPEEFHYR